MFCTQVVSFVSHTLYDPDQLLCRNSGQVPGTMQKFLGLLSKVGKPKSVAEDPPQTVPVPKDITEDVNIPTLKQLGYIGEKTSSLVGGETQGLKILTSYLENIKKTIEFEKPKTNPASIEPDTTSLSPYLKFGCISPKLFYTKISEVYEKVKGQHTRPPVSLLGKDLYYYSRVFELLCTVALIFMN